MLEAIRNLGILKMIEVFPEIEFDPSALDSVESFLEQRMRAIESGNYAKLQFEPITSDRIGIFAIDEDGRINFQEENVTEDSWKYLFLKTASQGTYITPTWKESQSKLKKTVEKYIEEAKHNDADWLQKTVKIFTAKDIEIGELDKNGNLDKKSFFDVIDWSKKNRKLKVFSVRINGKYNSKIKELLDFALINKPKTIFQTDKAKSFSLPGIKCILCDFEGELYPNVLSGAGINIANVDKPVFFPDVSIENSSKAFPICASCAEALYAAKFHVFGGSSKLRQNIAGYQTLIIPHLIESNNIEDGLEIVKSSLELLKKNLVGAERTEKDIIIDLSENKGIATVTFLMGDVAGQSIENIRKVIPDVIPSRLSKIGKAIDETNAVNDKYSVSHPWKLDLPPLNGNLRIIQDALGMPKYRKPPKGKRNPYKASYVNSLDVLNAIFLKSAYPLKDLLAEFSSKLSYDFLGASKDEEKVYSIRNNVAKMIYLLLFLEKLDVISMNSTNNFVNKYLKNYEGLRPLSDFLSNEAKGLDTREKEYAFLLGLLLGKLVSIQLAKQISANALKWLNGLQLSQNDLMEIFVKTSRKLDDYSTPNSAWSREMRGVAEAIGALGSDIDKWDIDRKEIAYYLCLGQSLSGYYLPSKGKEDQSQRND
jgi:CRISPR-associated Csh1 family protein